MLRVREVEAKSILNKSKIFDYCVNPYTGCQVGCAYCYASLFIPRYSGHSEPWGTFVDVKTNAPELLRRQLRRAKLGTVWLSSVCDPYQPLEAKHRLTRLCLEALVESGFPVNIQSKSVLLLRDADLMAGIRELEAGFTIATDDVRTARLCEPFASSPAERAKALRALRARGSRKAGEARGPVSRKARPHRAHRARPEELPALRLVGSGHVRNLVQPRHLGHPRPRLLP